MERKEEEDKEELVEEASTLPAPHPRAPVCWSLQGAQRLGPHPPGKVVTLSQSPWPSCGFLWQGTG